MKKQKLFAAVISFALCICSAASGYSSYPATAQGAVIPCETFSTETKCIQNTPDNLPLARAAKTTAKSTATTTTTATKKTTAKSTKTTAKTTGKQTSATKTTSTTSKPKTTVTTTVTTTTDISYTLGDVDNDQKYTGTDATIILQEYTLLSSRGYGNFSGSRKNACDINGDGIITGSDATISLNYYTYLSSGGVLMLEDFLKYGPIDIHKPPTTTTSSTTTTTTSTTTTETSTSSSSSTSSSTSTTTTGYDDPYTVQNIELSKYEITVKVGCGDISIVKMLPSSAPDKSEKWWSSDTGIATVNYEGWITGISPGECTVTIQSMNNPDVKAEIKVTVTDNKVQEIKLDKYEITIGVNQGDIPLVTMLPADAPDKSEKWWSSNTGIAAVNYEGWITGISPGKCTVTVQSVNNPNVKAEVSVTVIDNSVTEIKLDRYEITIKKDFGDMPLVTMLPADAPDKSEIWKSSNTNIATVNFEGWIYGIAPGECTVTVYSAANPDVKAEVKVIVTE